MLRCSVNNLYWQAILSNKAIVGNLDPFWSISALLGDVDKPLPNKFTDIIKCFSGFIALLVPKKPSFLLWVPV